MDRTEDWYDYDIPQKYQHATFPALMINDEVFYAENFADAADEAMKVFKLTEEELDAVAEIGSFSTKTQNFTAFKEEI